MVKRSREPQVVRDGLVDDGVDRARRATSALEEEIAAYLAEFGVDDERHAIVRPYARTGGRTRAAADLAIETLLSTASDDVPVQVEHQRIWEICLRPNSVAEIAAYTRLPIGAARVIIADMLVLGLLRLCSAGTSQNGPTTELMSRVLSGLRRL